MLIGLIYMGTDLFILACLLLGNLLVIGKKNEYLLFMKISGEQRTEPEVTALVKEYKKSLLSHAIGLVLLSFVPCLIGDFSSLQVLFMTLWCTAAILLDYRMNKTYANRMYELKKEKGWLQPSKKTVRAVDTKVSRMKKSMPVSALWFVVPIWLCIGSVLWWCMKGADQKGMLLMPITNILVTCFFLFLYRSVTHGKLKVYSEDSDINYTLNRVAKRAWSGCIVVETSLQAVYQFLVMLQLSAYFRKVSENKPEAADSFLWALLFESLILTVLLLIPFVQAKRKIRQAKKELLGEQTEQEEEDEDFFWRNGYYSNPNDTDSFVENRQGYGMTTNMAGAWGSITKWVLLVTLIFCIGLGIGLMPLDFGTVTAEASEKKIELRAGMYYKKTIELSDVTEVVLLTSRPEMSRIWGSGMKQMALGDYHFADYGNGTAMIRRDADYYLMVKNTKGKWTGFSVKDNAEMLRFYEILTEAAQKTE